MQASLIAWNWQPYCHLVTPIRESIKKSSRNFEKNKLLFILCNKLHACNTKKHRKLNFSTFFTNSGYFKIAFLHHVKTWQDGVTRETKHDQWTFFTHFFFTGFPIRNTVNNISENSRHYLIKKIHWKYINDVHKRRCHEQPFFEGIVHYGSQIRLNPIRMTDKMDERGDLNSESMRWSMDETETTQFRFHVTWFQLRISDWM